MQVPVEISFRNVAKEPWVEEDIRTHIAKLESIFDRLTSCRVRVEQRATNANDTIPPVVHIELGIPGFKDIVVAHEPDRIQRRYQNRNIRTAIDDAFHIAKKQLVDWKEKYNTPTRNGGQEIENQLVGQVADLPEGRDFGFLMNSSGGLLYFHRNSLLSGDFDSLKRGDEVTYVESDGDTGPAASKVRARSSTQ
jgi:cold shock CspA family protein/ribosome-associated translation inhibitor RaiA